MPFTGTHTAAPADGWQATEPLDPAAWIPLTELALEGLGRGDDIESRARSLRDDLADEVLYDDIGRACVPRSVARQMFADRAQRQARAQERERARLAELAANAPTRQTHARVKAIQEAQRDRPGLLREEDERW